MYIRSLRRLYCLIASLMILSTILSACGNKDRTIPEVVTNGRPDALAILSTARKYYNEGVNIESNQTVLFRAYEQKYNTLRTGARDLIANNQSCFSNVAATESAIAEAVMGNQPADALISALSTGSVSGEVATSQCVQLNRQVADYIVANRAAVQDAYMASFEHATKYMLYFSDYPEIDFMNDLMQTYGNPDDVLKFLADNNIGVTDWSWLPTANLWVSHSDEQLCRYYISGDFMANVNQRTKNKFAGHETSLMGMYESSWNPAAFGGRGECRMTRMAALEYMTRNLVSADTRENIESGEDTGLFATPETE